MKQTIEKKSQFILGIMGLLLTLIYIINAFKLGDFSGQVYAIAGIGIGAIMLIEGGVMDYFRQKKYKTIDVKDFVVWLTMGTAIVVLVNTIIGYQIIQKNLPEAITTFFGSIAGVVGIIASIMILIQIITPRFEG